MHGTGYAESIDALYRKYVNTKRIAIYEVPEVLRRTTKRRHISQSEEDTRSSFLQVGLLRNTGLFLTADDSTDFAGFLNNYVVRKFNCDIVPRSLKWHVSDCNLGEIEMLPHHDVRTTAKFTLRHKSERDFYERVGEYAELVENGKKSKVQLSRNVSSNGLVKFSYVCGCTVALTHGLPCVHITSFA